MFAISRIASKLNAVNNLVRKNLSNNNNNDNNDNNDNINRWSSDLWSDSTPKSITNKLLKLLDSSGLKGKMQIRKSGRSSSSSSMRRQRAHTIEYNSNNKPSNILDEINSNCLLLKKFLRNRRKIIFMTKKEKTNAIYNLLDCGIRLCQYLLLNGFETSIGSRGVGIYDFILNLLSRQEFDHVHVHNNNNNNNNNRNINNLDEVLNSLGETYFQFATNAIKVAVNNCYWGQDLACGFSGKVFAKLIWRFPILGGYVVDSFPTQHVNHLLKLYKSSTYTHYYKKKETIMMREEEEKRKNKATNNNDSILVDVMAGKKGYAPPLPPPPPSPMKKFILDCPDLFSWTSSFRYAPLTKIIFDQAKEYSIRNNREEIWNYKLKMDVVFSFSFCTTFIRHVKMVFDYRRNSHKYKDTVIVWNQLPLYTFLADHICVLLRDYLRYLKKKVHRDKQVEQEVTRRSNSIGSQNDSNNNNRTNNNSNSNNILNSSALFERLKELEDAEYYSNLAESDKKTGNRKRRGDPVPLPPHGNDKNDSSTTSNNNVFNKNKANQFQKNVVSRRSSPVCPPPIIYDQKFVKMLTDVCVVFAENDPDVGVTIVTILLNYFDYTDYASLEFYYDTLVKILQCINNKTVGKIMNSKLFHNFVSKLIHARSISVACHGVAIVFQTRMKLEYHDRLKFTRWYLNEHFYYLFLHWSSLVRQFFYHYLFHGIFTVQRKFLTITTDEFILNNEHLNFFKQRKLRKSMQNNTPLNHSSSMDGGKLTISVEKIEFLQSKAPYDLSICSLVDTFMHVVLSAHYNILLMEDSNDLKYSQDEQFRKNKNDGSKKSEGVIGVDVTAFLTKNQMNYVKPGLSEYEITLKNSYAHEKRHAQKNTYQAPIPLPLRIQNIRGLLHH